MQYLHQLLQSKISVEEVTSISVNIIKHHRLFAKYLDRESNAEEEKKKAAFVKKMLASLQKKGNMSEEEVAKAVKDAEAKFVYVRDPSYNMKPKHHFLLHFATMILKWGPPRSYWCMRFEARHQEVKKVINSSNWISIESNAIERLDFSRQLKLMPFQFKLNNNVGKKIEWPIPYLTGLNFDENPLR